MRMIVAEFRFRQVGSKVVSWGTALHHGDSVAQVRLQNVQQIQSTDDSFAAVLGDGTVVTWGKQDGYDGCTCLENVRQIQSTAFAFAAILGDGSVVTWGDASYGGDSSAVRDQLKLDQC